MFTPSYLGNYDPFWGAYFSRWVENGWNHQLSSFEMFFFGKHPKDLRIQLGKSNFFPPKVAVSESDIDPVSCLSGGDDGKGNSGQLA